MYHTGISFKSALKCHRAATPSLRGVSQFEQTASGLWGFPNNLLSVQTPRWQRNWWTTTPPQQQCWRHFALPACGATTCTSVHPRSSSPVSSSSFQLQFWRLLTLFAPTAASCSASGVICTSPGSSATPSLQHSSRVSSAKTSPHCLFSLGEENGKLFNFFSAS